MVLDPFMGGGATVLACMEMGRRFTGVELSPEYYDVAMNRLKGVEMENSKDDKMML